MLHRGMRRALVLLFCGCLAAVGVLYLALPKADFSEREKRRLAELPKLTWSGVLSGDFESGFESWMSDHIPGREALVGLNAYYSLASGRNGLDGTLYADGKLYDAAWELDADAVARKCEIISRFARETGLPTDVLIVPTSGYMCESALPMHAKYRDGELAELVRGGLSGSARLIWPEEALRAAGGQLYYNTDHHLTSRGAYEICKLYAESLGLEMPGEDEYDVEVHEGFYGSMYAQSGLWAVKPDSLEIWRSRRLGKVEVGFDDRESAGDLFFPEHLAEMDKYPVFLDGNHALVTIETDNKAGENLLMIRDSFGHCFAPFAADSFHRIALVDLRYYRGSVTELAKEMEIDRALVLYGADSFAGDSNFGWLR